MSIYLLEDAVAALGDLKNKVVFLGAATLPLWITDPAAPPLRPTIDVDVVVEVTTLISYNRFEARLREAGFVDEGTVLGRFLFGDEKTLQLDAIPADASLLGFENRWQQESLPAAVTITLPSQSTLRALPPPQLLATKLEAFAGRGHGDFFASQDFEDIVALIDGREELVGEVAGSGERLRAYVAGELNPYLQNPRAHDAVVAHLEPGGEARERADSVVVPRMRALAQSPIS